MRKPFIKRRLAAGVLTPAVIGRAVSRMGLNAWVETGRCRTRARLVWLGGWLTLLMLLLTAVGHLCQRAGARAAASWIGCAAVVVGAIVGCLVVAQRGSGLFSRCPPPWLSMPCGADERGVRLRRPLRRLVEWEHLRSMVDCGDLGLQVRYRWGVFALDRASKHQVLLGSLIAAILKARDEGRLLFETESADADAPGAALSPARLTAQSEHHARALKRVGSPGQCGTEGGN